MSEIMRNYYGAKAMPENSRPGRDEIELAFLTAMSILSCFQSTPERISQECLLHRSYERLKKIQQRIERD